MTGYLYQCELALLGLAERSWDDIAIEVRMEVLDDIEFLYNDTNDPSELLQPKHRESAGRLSDTGKDFWRSVASWIDALTALDRLATGVMPQLRLVTTQVTTKSDLLWYLRPGTDRSVDEALARMEQIAQSAGPTDTAIDRRDTGLRCPRAPKAASTIESEEVADCARRASLVARWLAIVDPVLAFNLLGVRP